MADPISPERLANYRDYQQAFEYERVEGVLLLPTVDGAPVVIETHEPYRVKRVTYAGKGVGEPTIAPRPPDSATLLRHTHANALPIPFQSGEGNGYVYSCTGTYTVLEGGAGLLSTASYDCPRYPYPLEPMRTETRLAGYGYYPGELVSGVPVEFDPADPRSRWPQSLTITSACFSEQLA